VLLALARGSGPRGLAGMPVEREIRGVSFVRPLLGVSRETCRHACVALGLSPWDDPHNTDSSYARARVRKDVMPVLVEALGADVVPNLARTAAQLGADTGYLDELADQALRECRVAGGLAVAALQALPDPLRTRVLHAWVAGLGVPRAALSHRHIAALDALITGWHGQGATQLPGRLSVRRAEGVLLSDNRS
jgi:tRNA(Ile)-lysidine synthase